MPEFEISGASIILGLLAVFGIPPLFTISTGIATGMWVKNVGVFWGGWTGMFWGVGGCVAGLAGLYMADTRDWEIIPHETINLLLPQISMGFLFSLITFLSICIAGRTISQRA